MRGKMSRRQWLSSRSWPVLLSAGLVLAAGGSAVSGQARHFDAREGRLVTKTDPAPRQLAAASRLRAAMPDLAVEFEDSTGATRTLWNQAGYLTGADRSADARTVALKYVAQNLDLLGIGEADLAGHETTDSVYSAVTGATHLYLRQVHQGIPVHNAQLHVNVNREGRILSVNNAFVPEIGQDVGRSPVPGRTAIQALEAAAVHLGVKAGKVVAVVESRGDPRQTQVFEAAGLSTERIKTQLVWVPVGRGDVRLAWQFIAHVPGTDHVYEMTVDANTDQVWIRYDQTADADYQVYALPAESPSHTTPLPPADGRTTLTNPQDGTASPFGWHDTNGVAGAEFTTTRGNNVHAYEDRDANNAPPAADPNCGVTLSCVFPLNLTLAPSGYIAGAVTNLFYLNNVIHDVQYQYGFDEAAGNFQVNNYGRGGAGNDDVRAEAQDGGGTNNANFSTPADGSRPRMQMYLWTAPNPDRDGDLDNGIIIHEYGHGISNRLVGGPANVGCLGNSQQPGEGLSDWWALAYTHEPGDLGTDGRGIGTYALNQATSGLGIRTQRYSTNPAINTWTYASISGMAIPHGVGSVWAQGAWEAYWALVDVHGFDPDLYDAFGGSGNQRMMLYVNEGLKNTACSPTFLNVRDGILQAATDNFGGEDVCTLWQAFAAYGMGTNAVSGGSGSTSPTNGFNLPIACQGPSTTIFSDDFETDKGWTRNPNGTDNATTGLWERGNPQDTNSSGPKQLGTTTSGVNDLSTGPLAGAAAGDHDIDGGTTTIQSPAIVLPASGTLTLSFNYYMAHGTNSSSADFFRVQVVGATTTQVFQELNAANDDDAVWATGIANISAFAGQTVRIRFEAADASGASLVEAAVDDVLIIQQ